MRTLELAQQKRADTSAAERRCECMTLTNAAAVLGKSATLFFKARWQGVLCGVASETRIPIECIRSRNWSSSTRLRLRWDVLQDNVVPKPAQQ